MKLPKTLYSILATIIVQLMAVSCVEDSLDNEGNYGPEGEPTTISLSLSVPSFTQLSRADMSEETAFTVNTLWVGIYNKSTGKQTFGALVDNTNGFNAGQVNPHTPLKLSNIPTESGESYIVAVANPIGNYGVDINTPTTLEELSGLLAKATTWDKYRAIAIRSQLLQQETLADIELSEVGTAGLPMSGVFASDHNYATETGVIPSVFIPIKQSSLSGEIHLRRLISHISFNITVGENTELNRRIISIIPQTYKVYNVPVYSWLQERNNVDGSTDKLDLTNAGDAITATATPVDNPNYKPSLIYRSSDFVSNNDGTSYSFDFWQAENKRTGLTSCTTYQDREKEWCGTLDNLVANDPLNPDKAYQTPTTGVYVSLYDGTPLSAASSAAINNNLATYVEIACTVNYIEKTTTEDSWSQINGMIPSEGSVRTADIIYTVHLGYVGTNPDPKDFNSLRNSQYTYNMNITGLYSVMVEAFRTNEGSMQPGNVGLVTDADEYFDMDCHYGVFNIFLSEENLNAFSYSITAYDENGRDRTTYYFKNAGETKPNTNYDNLSPDDMKYYNWIELAKVTGIADDENSESITQKRTLQKYPGKKSDKLFHLHDIATKTYNGQPMDFQPGWYTVYVDEYAYDDMNWRFYVGQRDRKAFLNVAETFSTNGQSAYYQSKYAVNQKSMQTYYNIDGSATEALALEHVNEIDGVCLRWPGSILSSNILNDENGRSNAWYYINTQGATVANASALSASDDMVSWDLFMNENSLQTINATRAVQGISARAARHENVPQLVELGTDVISGTLAAGAQNAFKNARSSLASIYDPQTQQEAQYIQVISACLNRNRDLDGNGMISKNELRWFVPSIGQYLRMIIGRNSLSVPIMSYPNSLTYQNSSDMVTRYHFAGSDGKCLWAEQGGSSSFYYNSSEDLIRVYSAMPWQIRCVRMLGLSETQYNDITSVASPAYDTDDWDKEANGGGIVKVRGYYGTALRNPTTQPLTVHRSDENENRISRTGFEYYAGDISDFTAANANQTCQNLNNDSNGYGWRVPNQKELLIMRRISYKLGNSTVYALDHTNNAVIYWMSMTHGAYPSVGYQNGTSGTLSLTNDPSSTNYCTVTWNAATLTGYVNRLRCVRDLTDAETNMTYQQIKDSRK